MTTKSRGFTLIELLVVVAILGIIAAIGITSYSGYVSSTEKKAAENIMRQIALGQSEYYSENSIYKTEAGTSCKPTNKTSTDIEDELLGEAKVIIDPNSKDNPKEATSGYVMCIAEDPSGYLIYAAEQEDPQNGCNMSLYADSTFKRDDKKC